MKNKILFFNFSFCVFAFAWMSQANAKVDDALFKSRLNDLRTISGTNSTCSNDLFSQLGQSGQIRISIVFGYNDQRPYVNVLDTEERRVLEEGLQQNCSSPQDRLCGFSKNSQGLLVKNTHSRAGHPIALSIQLISSSMSAHDEWNRTVARAEQQQLSIDSEKQFIKALNESDVVFYTGHARGGGGPDFYPPRLKSNGQVDLPSYQAETRGLKILIDNLQRTRSLQLLGLFACDADNHFSKTLLRTRKDISLILAQAVTVPTLIDYAMWGALHSILGNTCSAETAKSISQPPAGQKAAPFRIVRQ